MAIKEVKYIPNDKTNKPSQRDIIRSDIKEALSKRIERFEFEDERYNYRSLYGNVRETLKEYFEKKIFFPAIMRAKESLKERISGSIWVKNSAGEYFDDAFTVQKRTLKDRVHVYVTINYDLIDSLQGRIMEETYDHYAKERPEQIIK